MKRRRLGNQGLEVSTLGLGCMGMSEFYGPADEAESRATLEMAVDRGITFLDTADMYGAGKNEELLSDLLRRRRGQIVLATKFGIVRDPAAPTDATRRKIVGKADYVRSACEASLRRLKVDVIDLYYQHRVDPSTPIEETVGAMAQLVKEGKVRALGLSEAPVDVIRRAAAVPDKEEFSSPLQHLGHAPGHRRNSGCILLDESQLDLRTFSKHSPDLALHTPLRTDVTACPSTPPRTHHPHRPRTYVQGRNSNGIAQSGNYSDEPDLVKRKQSRQPAHRLWEMAEVRRQDGRLDPQEASSGWRSLTRNWRLSRPFQVFRSGMKARSTRGGVG